MSVSARSAENSASPKYQECEKDPNPARVYAACTFRAVSVESGADVLQSTLREIVARFPSFRFRTDVAFRSWILTIALHQIVSRTRSHSATRRDVGRAEDLASRLWDLPNRDEGSHAGTPSRHVVHAEELERLQRALDGLDDEDREIVCLRRIFDVPAAEIAEITGLAESTVRWRLAQAMTKLASELE